MRGRGTTLAVIAALLMIAAAVAISDFREARTEQHTEHAEGKSNEVAREEQQIQQLIHVGKENKAYTIEVLCEAINDQRTYDREYQHETLKSTESNAHAVYEAIHGNKHLDRKQIRFLRLYLGTILTLERHSPKLLTLHPYTLPNLNCAMLAAAARA